MPCQTQSTVPSQVTPSTLPDPVVSVIPKCVEQAPLLMPAKDSGEAGLDFVESGSDSALAVLGRALRAKRRRSRRVDKFRQTRRPETMLIDGVVCGGLDGEEVGLLLRRFAGEKRG